MSRRPQVLIVEDDVFIREGLEEFLGSEGFAVRTADNGRAGLAALRELGGRCVVLLDLQMPVMTGEQFLEELARSDDPRDREAAVLVLTARAEGLQHPCVADLLRKPVGLEELLRAVIRLGGAPS